MDKLKQFIEEEDPIAKIEILMNLFGVDGFRDRFEITDLTEDFIETLDVYTAFDFIEMYEDFIVKKWKNML